MPAGTLERGPVLRPAKPQPQVAQRLVAAERQIHAVRMAGALALTGEIRVDQLLRLDVLALKQQPPNLRQGLVRVGPIRLVVTRAGPDGTFVEHDPLFIDAAKHHRANAPVAERQRLVKARGRFVKPERRCWIGSTQGCGQAEQAGHKRNPRSPPKGANGAILRRSFAIP